MRNVKTLLWVAWGAVVLASVCQTALSAENGIDRLNQSTEGMNISFDNFMRETLRDYSVPGAVVAVVENNTTIFLKGYGVREIGKTEKVDENTRFQVASVTKFFTATALGVLVDEGKLDWDTPIIEYIPEFAMNDAYATLHATSRDMLAHRSGFKHFDGDLLGRLNYSRAEILRKARYLEPGSSFRGKYDYSNIGIFIAGEVGARADNSSWEEVVSSRILTPLGMNRSGPNMAELFKDGNRATAHNMDNTIMPYESSDKTGAAGSVVSTGANMALWMHMLLTGDGIDGRHILTPETLKEIFKPSMVTGSGGPLRDPAGAAGLGCDSYDFLGHRVIEKNGALDGVRSVTVLIPDKKIGITVIANKQLTQFPEAVRAEFLERYLGSTGMDLQAQIHEMQLLWNTLAEKPKLPDKPNQPCKDIGAYTGNYLSDAYGIFSVVQNESNLTIEAGPVRYPGKLQHWSDNTFLLTFPDPDDPSGLINFAIGPSGNITGFDGADYRFGSMANFGHFDKV
jgi:CubicO group peptidase (beta-lactamase class C family)